ncbi:patatin-like phospholipase family protein [Thalassobius vesicularis]|uniref:Patatin-like phospholipase family protein n=1 Tax=Thalassobius vesicularis TaxID=1294297 RepID=A0A4V3UZ48_9RHOB|nr:patatin-like phospholipase family protein [Thalassobius vesicularis]THD74852.1 patatin-like phospholipase family protein [Thalassobius vesicularis]
MAKKRINLALQGGGAHGAFTWGVLDRLLEEGDIEIAAISGTSAGAMNGAALKSGWIEGGAEGAREKLDWLWGKLGAVHDMRMTTWLAGLMPDTTDLLHTALEYSLPFTFADTVSRMSSPYAFGPFYQNPLRKIAEAFEYEKVCADAGPRLFVGATNVRTGRIRVFSGEEMSADVLLASTCLPTLFQAVDILDPQTGQTEAFWDGGYTGNPALFPLFGKEFPDDILIVNINPLERAEVPVTPQEIQNRINEISFNSSLLRELRVISYAQQMRKTWDSNADGMKNINIHMIADDALMNELSASTKVVPSPFLLVRLKQAGRAAAEGFLAAHKSDLNTRSSVDLNAMFL